jgi:flagellar biosynthesis protein
MVGNSGKKLLGRSGVEVGETAVALSYDMEEDKEGAPKVIAKGRGEVADRILSEALRYGLPVERDGDLVSLLYASEIGEEIPVEAFIVVAEILRYIYERDGRL